MLDPDNAKDSILDEVAWTDASLKEYLRPMLNVRGLTVTFDPYEEHSNVREVRLRMHLSAPKSALKYLYEVLNKIGQQGIETGYAEQSGDMFVYEHGQETRQMYVMVLVAKRFKEEPVLSE